MSLKNFTQSIVLVGLATVYAAIALAETAKEPAGPPVKAAPAKSHRDGPPHAAGNVGQAGKPNLSRSSADDQDELIREILGVAGPKSLSENSVVGRSSRPSAAKDGLEGRPTDTLARANSGFRIASKSPPEPAPSDAESSVFKFAAAQPETSARPPSTKPSRQNGYGSVFGRIIRIDLDTNTVDIQFEGRRQTTVGSKFSVEHDYAFTTEYLGKLEIIYLAGGNRAIAKPGARTDITKMGKGDRVGGRVVPNTKGASAGGVHQPGAGGSSAQGGSAGGGGWQSQGGSWPAPSCVTPPIDKMPQPPPDPAIPYAPEGESAPEEPGPAPGITQPGTISDSLAAYRSALSREPSNALTNTVRQDAAAAVAQRPSAPSGMRSTALPADPTKSPRPSTPQRAQSPLAVRVRPSGPTHHAPREKWTGITARSWDALIKPNRNSPATVLLARQSAKTASLAGSPSKSLWCAVKPKRAGAAKATHTAALPARPARQATVLLFESE